jgi:hypothetical protein
MGASAIRPTPDTHLSRFHWDRLASSGGKRSFAQPPLSRRAANRGGTGGRPGLFLAGSSIGGPHPDDVAGGGRRAGIFLDALSILSTISMPEITWRALEARVAPDVCFFDDGIGVAGQREDWRMCLRFDRSQCEEGR